MFLLNFIYFCDDLMFGSLFCCYNLERLLQLTELVVTCYVHMVKF